MSNRWRQYEILLPRQFNDGADVPRVWHAEAVKELVAKFNAASYEIHKIQGQWRFEGVVYNDTLSKIVVVVPDTEENHRWMIAYRDRWKAKLKQIEIWLVSHPVRVE